MKLTKEKVCLWTFSEGILKHKTTLVESLTGLLSDTGSTPVASTRTEFMKLTKEKVCLWTFSEGILKHKTTLVESLTGLLSDTGSTPVASTTKTSIIQKNVLSRVFCFRIKKNKQYHK